MIKLFLPVARQAIFSNLFIWRIEKKYVGISYKAPISQGSKKIIATVAASLIVKAEEMSLLSSIPSLKEITSDELLESANPSILSVQQIDCLFYYVKGMSIKQIGNTLNLSPRTAGHYLDTVKTKLGCRTRYELINQALQMQVIKDRL